MVIELERKLKLGKRIMVEIDRSLILKLVLNIELIELEFIKQLEVKTNKILLFYIILYII